MTKYYILGSDRLRSGPHTLGELANMLDVGSVAADVQCCAVGGKEWKSLSEVLVAKPPRILPEGDAITWKVTWAIWWALAWRSLVVILPVAFLVAFLTALSSPSSKGIQEITNAIVTIAMIPVYVTVLRRVLTQGLAGYRIRVFRTEQTA
jgi:hypothetical protein